MPLTVVLLWQTVQASPSEVVLASAWEEVASSA
jgi:hypothetical protein